MKNTYAFISVTILLILVSTFFITGTVQSQSVKNPGETERYYQELEKEYVRDIRDYLNANGYENSGVTLTCTVDEEGNREYRVTLHHKYLEKLSGPERENIFAEIADMAFWQNGCIFRINLLV